MSPFSKKAPVRFFILAASVSLLVACQPTDPESPDNQGTGAGLAQLPPSPILPDLKPDNVIVGQVILRSPLPDPKTSNYDDCLYTAEIYVLRIESGKPIQRSITVALPGFLKRTVTESGKYKIGDLVHMTLSSIDSVPESVKTLQRSDTLENVSLDFFYALSSTKLEKTAANLSPQDATHFLAKPGAAKKTSPPVAYPRSEKAAALRSKSIANDIQTIRKRLKSHGNDWQQWSQELDPFFADLRQQVEQSPDKELRKGKLYFESLHDDNYLEICEQIDSGSPGPFSMLKGLSQQLRERGIDLVVAPLPFKEDVNAGHFSNLAPEDGVFVPHRQKFLLHLLEADVEVLDLVPSLLQGLDRFPYVFYDGPDAHPADGAIRISAHAVAERLKRYDFQSMPGYQTLEFKTEDSEFVIQKTAAGFVAGSRYPATVVDITAGGFFETKGERRPSPIVLIGDSVTLVPMQLNGTASFPIHLAKDCGLEADPLFNLGGSSQAMHHIARAGKNFLSNRWVMVFYFSPNRLMGKKSSMGDRGAWNLIDLPPLMLE
jgi:hypothetical protein